MRRAIALMTLTAFLLPMPGTLWAQGEKQDAALTPVAAIGEISSGERRIIFTRLQSLLSEYYKLVSQSDYAAAEELAFEQLAAEQCTEEQCIRAIQDILQVERLFTLQIVREGDFTQLSLILTRTGDKIVRDDTCEECSISDLHGRVERLVNDVVRDDIDVQALVQALPDPAAQTAALEEEEGSSWWIWALGGLALVGLAVAASGSSGGGGGKGNGSSSSDDCTPTTCGDVSVTW